MVSFDVESVQTQDKNPWLSRGTYELTILDFRAGEKRGSKMKYFGVDFKVDKSEGPGATAPGTIAGYGKKQDEYGYYLKALKELIAAVLNERSSTLKNTTVDEIVADQEVLKGRKVKLVVKPEEKKPQYDKYVFSHIPT